MKPFLLIGATPIPTYLLILSLTYSSLLIWLIRRAKVLKYDRQHTLDLALAVMIGGFVGARLIHVVYEHPEIYLADPLRVVQFWQGGFVFYGGALGAWLASEWVLSRRQLPRGYWQDLFTPLFPLGYALGRLGCFAAGCCFGSSSLVPWAVTFPPGSDAPSLVSLHPTQLYAFAWDMFLFFAVLILERARSDRFWKRPGFLFFAWLLFHAIGRLLMEEFRADDRGDLLLGQSVSTWISYFLILFASFVLIRKSTEGPHASRAA